LSGIESLEEC